MQTKNGKHRALPENTGLGRRRFLTFVVAAPTLTVATRSMEGPNPG